MEDFIAEIMKAKPKPRLVILIARTHQELQDCKEKIKKGTFPWSHFSAGMPERPIAVSFLGQVDRELRLVHSCVRWRAYDKAAHRLLERAMREQRTIVALWYCTRHVPSVVPQQLADLVVQLGSEGHTILKDRLGT